MEGRCVRQGGCKKKPKSYSICCVYHEAVRQQEARDSSQLHLLFRCRHENSGWKRTTNKKKGAVDGEEGEVGRGGEERGKEKFLDENGEDRVKTKGRRGGGERGRGGCCKSEMLSGSLKIKK